MPGGLPAVSTMSGDATGRFVQVHREQRFNGQRVRADGAGRRCHHLTGQAGLQIGFHRAPQIALGNSTVLDAILMDDAEAAKPLILARSQGYQTGDFRFQHIPGNLESGGFGEVNGRGGDKMAQDRCDSRISRFYGLAAWPGSS